MQIKIFINHIIFIISFSFLTFGCCISKRVYTYTLSDCSSFFAQEGRYWKIDTLGKSGFRLLAVDHILLYCQDLKGEPWNKFSKDFGTPNRIENYNSSVGYEYFLTDFPIYFQKISLIIHLDNSSKIIDLEKRIYD